MELARRTLGAPDSPVPAVVPEELVQAILSSQRHG
jgi:hypothetical protein